jgi:hypothetical protein
MAPNLKRLRQSFIVICALLLLAQISVLAQIIPVAMKGRTDFASLFTAGYMVVSGHGKSIYDGAECQKFQREKTLGEVEHGGFDRPSYEALLFVPLSRLNFPIAYFVMLATNMALLAFGVRMLYPYLKTLESVLSWLPAAVFLSFLPISFSLAEGGDSILLLVLVVASAVSSFRTRELIAGMFLGLCIFNFSVALPIAMLFLLWRRWRLVCGFACSSLGAGLLSMWVSGVKPLAVVVVLQRQISWRNLVSMPQEGLRCGSVRVAIPNLGFLANILGRLQLSQNVILTVTAVLCILLLLWTATRPASFALAILVALLIDYREQISDLALLAVPIAFVLEARISAYSGNQLRARNIAILNFVAPTLLFLLGQGYGVLILPMAALLPPLRTVSTKAVSVG